MLIIASTEYPVLHIAADLALMNPAAQKDTTPILRVELRVRFNGPDRSYDDSLAKFKAALQTEVSDFFQTHKLKAIANDLSAQKVAKWVVSRLAKKAPRNFELQNVTLTCPLLIPSHDHYQVDRRDKEDSKSVHDAFLKATMNISPPLQPTDISLLKPMYVGALRDKGGMGERYLSRQDMADIARILQQKKQESKPAIFVNFICPPYAKTSQDGAHKNYNSIHPNFADPPASYNFNYNYYVPIDIMSAMQSLCEREGVTARSYIVLGDWSLICIDNILATLGSEEQACTNLTAFFNGMNGHLLKQNKGIELTSFRKIGVPDILPIGLPYSVEARLAWLEGFSRDDTKDDFDGLRRHLRQLLSVVDHTEDLNDMLDWRQYDDLYQSITQTSDEPISKSLMVEIAKVYGNIYELKKSEESFVADGNAEGLHKTAYIDTLLRYTQYQIFSRLFTKRYGSAICMYSDPKFSSCGHFFRQGDMAVAFVDEKRILQVVNNGNAHDGIAGHTSNERKFDQK